MLQLHGMKRRRPYNYVDITGQRFGKLIAISELPKRAAEKHRRWRFQCDCGTIVVVPKCHAVSGHTTSCGCLRADLGPHVYATRTTHRLSRTKLYNVYFSMMRRCYDTRHDSYPNYGGREITVCKEWRNDLSKFFDWALANDYREGLHLDRKKNHLGYSPGNCRWLTPIDSCNNKRNNHRITYDGETLSIAQWSRKLDINHRVLRARIHKGWSYEKTLRTPVLKRAICSTRAA